MDIQLNIGHRSLSYLCKYVTKLDTHHKFRIEKSGNANQNDDSLHFKARSIGSIEAVYDVLGLHKQSSDTDVLFLDTALPNERSRTIKTKLNSGESIYNDHTIVKMIDADFLSFLKLDIYLQRPRNPEFENIAYPEYFANYARSHSNSYFAFNATDAYLHLVSTHQIPPPQDHVPVPVNDIPHPLEDQDADETIPDEQVTYLLNHQRLSHTELHERVSQLSPDQYTNFQTILRNVDDRLPTIVHGGAGTGKSFLLDTISLHYSQLRYTVFRLAYTGVAAYNINGVTLHRFFGMANQNRLVNPIRLDQTLQDNPKCIFLIDECSMLAADFVDELDKELRKAKKNQLPWGGLPVVFFGDFGQLQPWGKESHPFWRSNLASHHAQYRSLTTSIRQSGSIHFQTFLDQVRLYHFTSEVVATLASRCYSKSQLPPDCIHLFSTLKAAKAMNTRKLSKIPGTSRHYPATDNLSGMGDIAVQALEKTYLPKMLSLKLEAKVMLLQNLDVSAGWVNGRLAFVVKMDDDCIHIRAADHPDLTLIIHRIERSIPFTAYSRLQFPVTLAWAFTVHKVQSLTLSKVAIDFNNLFAHGHLYVALSRVRQLKHVYIVNWNARKPIRTFNYDESTISIIKQLSELSHNE
ncbi:hypothetical protein NQZ79_g8342 [Umbelopsis isabellina]|nr:hypothetical protein NQZ79_g8342 [Umbelopsis isabellina]